MEDYLVLKGLSKSYRSDKGQSIRALEGFGLSLAKGEFVTLLGPSGCGKTTALRIIAGLEEPDQGELLLKGRRINRLPPYNRDMPMVFQSYALFPHMTVYENIAYGLRARKKSREVIRNDVAMACQMVNLVGLEKRFPGELSGGQQQRVALARTLVLKPEIILFDEPLSNLDGKLRIQTRREIKRVHRMLGITVLYVTHDQEEALSLSDRIVIMNRGRLVQSGPPEEIYRAPADAFAADFIGASNFISASVEETEGRRMTLRLQNSLLVMEMDQEGPAFSEGEEVYLSIRPEAVRISREATDFTGIVDVGSFLGSHREFSVEFEGSFINVLQPLRPGERPPAAGEKVYLRFDRELFRVYKK